MPMLEPDIIDLAKSFGITARAIPDAILQFPNDDKVSFGEWWKGEKAKKPHWLEPEAPVAGDETTSIMAQVAFVKKHGEAAAADHLAKFGLKLGHVKKVAASSGTTVKEESSASNPWSSSFKGGKELAEKRRLEIIRMDTRMAQRLSAKAGKRIDGGELLNQRKG